VKARYARRDVATAYQLAELDHLSEWGWDYLDLAEAYTLSRAQAMDAGD
jgi:hypothetical protein